MPTYTNPKTGKKIKSSTPLSEDQLNEAFGLTSGVNYKGKLVNREDFPTEEEVNAPESIEFKDVLQGAGLPSSLDEVGLMLSDNVNPINALAFNTPQAARMLQGVLRDSASRTGRYWDKLADEPTIGRATQTALAPIPFVGNVMENADRGIAEGDPHAQGRMIGNALAVAGPKIAKSAPGMARGVGRGVSAVGRGTMSAGRAVLENPTARTTAIGVGTLAATHNPLAALLATTLGSGKVARIINGLEEIATKGKPIDVTNSIKVDPVETPIDPRVTELKEIRLKNALAKERGVLPQGESDINIGDVQELKRLKLERQLEYERGQALKREGTISAKVDPDVIEDVPPIAKGSAIGDVAEFPTRYKNVKLKNPQQKLTPQPPNPYSRQDIPTNTDELELGAAPDQKMGVPVKTHEELLAVQELMASGIDQDTAVSIVTSKSKTSLPPDIPPTAPLNPRAKGTNPRARGTNPRALAEKRKGL